MRVKGTVTKAGKSKFSYFLMLDGNNYYYNTKFKPKCGEGDVVGIEYNDKGGNRGQITNVKIFESNSGGYDASNSERQGSFAGGQQRQSSGGGPDRNEAITWQSCQKTAGAVVSALAAVGAIASKGNPESKRAEVEAAFDELTVRLFEDALNPRASKTFKTVKQVDGEASGAEAASGGDSWDEDASNDDGDSWGSDSSADW